MLNPQIMEHILACYSYTKIDLFTSRENTKCELFFSLCPLDAPLGVDALAHTGPDNPHSRQSKIPPHWPTLHWLAEIYQMLCNKPWQSPVCRHLLSKRGGMVFDQHPERLQLL